MTNSLWARLRRAVDIRASALMAGFMSVAAVSAPAGELWVGTKNPVTGQFSVRTEALSTTFGDGTPVGSYSIQGPAGVANISNGFLLVRRTAAGSESCRTEALGVHLHGTKAYLNLDVTQQIVLQCANPPNIACGSCRIERDLNGYFCACIKDGSIAGECLGMANDLLKGDLIVDWLGPDPDPEENPGPHPDNR